MSWKETDAMDERVRFVLELEKGEESMAALCRRYGISRPCGYKWARRYAEEGVAGLEERSRRPHHCPHAYEPEIEEEIVAMRGKHPNWGPRKLKRELVNQDPERTWPASSTIGDILTRRGLTIARRRPRPRAAPSPHPLTPGTTPNRVWTVDYKGWFRTGDGTRCDPLTLLDGASRYLLRCQVVAHPDYAETQPVLEAAFREFGLPEVIRSDNGAPFASVGPGGLSRLSVGWMRLGIRPERIRPAQPQENGRHERFHRTLKQCTARPPRATIRAQQRCFDRFRREYNEHRPHEALGQQPPAVVYAPSPRSYPTRLPELAYPSALEVRTVHEHGQFRLRGRRVCLGRAFQGQPVGLGRIDERYWLAFFMDVLLGVFDLHELRLLRPAQAHKCVPDYKSATRYYTSTRLPSPGGGHPGQGNPALHPVPQEKPWEV